MVALLSPLIACDGGITPPRTSSYRGTTELFESRLHSGETGGQGQEGYAKNTDVRWAPWSCPGFTIFVMTGEQRWTAFAGHAHDGEGGLRVEHSLFGFHPGLVAKDLAELALQRFKPIWLLDKPAQAVPSKHTIRLLLGIAAGQQDSNCPIDAPNLVKRLSTAQFRHCQIKQNQ